MKKIKFLTLKKKNVAIFLLLGLVIAVALEIPKVIESLTPKAKYVVVIDAGHGGIDGGCEGASTGITEASLNLDYAVCLKNMLSDFGFGVVMTRTNESGLYNPLASNKKRDDMKKRKQIIENANADFVISIHMNSYSSSSRGAQVFYGKDDELSRSLASNIQNHFIKNLEFSRKEIKIGDYYILNEVKAPAVLVECGYLSNPKEEALLITEDYMRNVCYSIMLGVLEYLR